ncbi:Na+/H+ antiporter subunit E [Alkalicoccobacillus murimartini]|uniref:Multicomponent Na+:H+ antiporter subunit E n=1 Tax=Alkalicoccobacillus murimartini TaxID=171685 RepID=A0ABT9YCP4_9BACI|nr:Na+/H+ antiporter subunit E [Alkalicoccobacillus murimartini]MDQ0205496.1 multicomponent Na+:H+ antiporter subunit E [Alkalicoccobacillus murimartini]
MGIQLFIHVIVTFSWMLFNNSFTFVDFTIGFVIGIGTLWLFQRFFGYRVYLYKVWAVIKLLLLFIKELIQANIDVLKVVLSPKIHVNSGIIAVPTKLESPGEITLLAVLITLTPGTLSMDFSEDNQIIYVHALDISNREEMIKGFHDTFERAIMEVTR